MSKADPTISAREMRYRQAQKERGLKMVRVWCPADRVEELKKIAEKWREENSTTAQEPNQ